MTIQSIDPKSHEEFATYDISDEQDKKITRVRIYFNQILSELERLCPSGRYLSLVKTKLEEASFFANKAIASEGERK